MMTRLCRVLVICFVFVSGLSVSARERMATQLVRVKFLATGTAVRGTWGFNQDTYLAELVSPPIGGQVLIRLVDEYFNAAPPVSSEVLTSETGTMLRVRRDSLCDLPYASILLRTKPGDPRAILPERLGYEPQLDKIPDPGTIIPCYRMVRR
jgi:hypothetical protein